MQVITSLPNLDELEVKAVKSLKYNFETLRKVKTMEDRELVYKQMRIGIEVAIHESEILLTRED